MTASRVFTVFFTGLPGAGKSTLASLLAAELVTRLGPVVALFDGDDLRRSISRDLGFSPTDRRTHVARVASLAESALRAGQIAVCALVAPYDDCRKDARSRMSAVAPFVLVHVATPLDVCERRDPKGLYARARAGTVSDFTGVSDPYEVPDDAAISIDTDRMAAVEAVRAIMMWLEDHGCLPAPGAAGGART